jgi:uncharacterized protein (DUF4415 family)
MYGSGGGAMKAKPRKSRSKKARGKRANLADEGFDPALVEGSGRLYRPVKKPVTLRVDADVLMWFKAQGPGYQTRINRALRGLMLKDKKAGR